METELLEAAQAYCLGILGKGRCGDLPYHNPAHTMEVVDHARIIGTAEGLCGPDLIPLLLAALFHDTGIIMTFSHHEKVSARTAAQFLVENNYPPAGIAMVEHCILSTKLPQNPTTPIERVLRDADLFHLSSAEFSGHN